MTHDTSAPLLLLMTPSREQSIPPNKKREVYCLGKISTPSSVLFVAMVNLLKTYLFVFFKS